MAVSIDYSGAVKRIVIPQGDLTNISGTLYELDTERKQLERQLEDRLGRDDHHDRGAR